MRPFGFLGIAAIALVVELSADQLHGKLPSIMPGELLDGEPGRIRWSNPHWNEPWVFESASLGTIVFSERMEERPQGSWRILTQNGHSLQGELESVDESGYLISHAIWGKKRIPQKSIQLLERMDSPDRIFQASTYREWANRGPGPIRNLRYRVYELDEDWNRQQAVPKFSDLKLIAKGRLPSGRIDFGVIRSDRPRGVLFEGEVELQDNEYHMTLNSQEMIENTPQWGRLTIGDQVLDLDLRTDKRNWRMREVAALSDQSGKCSFRFEYLGKESAKRIYPYLSPQGSSGLVGNMRRSYTAYPHSLMKYDSDPLPDWRESADGKLTTEKKRAAVMRMATIPERFEMKLELSSTHRPRFFFGLGRKLSEAKSINSFRLETWDDTLVVTRGDTFKVVRFLKESDREIRLRLRYDGSNRKLSVFSPDDRLLVRWHGARIDSGFLGVCLVNEGHNLTVERISLEGGNFSRQSLDDQDRVRLIGGKILPGRLHHEATTDTWTIISGTERRVVTLEQVDRVMHAPVKTAPEVAEVKLYYGQNTVLGGRLLNIDRESMVLATGLTETPLICARKGLERVSFLDSEGLSYRSEFDLENIDLLAAPSGHYEAVSLDRASLRTPHEFFYGKLQFREGAEPLWWLPLGAIEPQAVESRFVGQFQFDLSTRATFSAITYPNQIWLLGGAAIPCRVVSFSEDQLVIQTPDLGRSTIDVRHLRAVEFALYPHQDDSRIDWIATLIRVNPERPESAELAGRNPNSPNSKADESDKLVERIENALRIPHLSPAQPASYLIVANNGDVLRGELLGIDEDSVRLRLKRRELTFERNRIRLIVRMVPPERVAERNLIRVMTKSFLDLDLQFEGLSVEEDQLALESPVFGRCLIPFGELHTLTLGDFLAEYNLGGFDTWVIKSNAALPNDSNRHPDPGPSPEENPIP